MLNWQFPLRIVLRKASISGVQSSRQLMSTKICIEKSIDFGSPELWMLSCVLVCVRVFGGPGSGSGVWSVFKSTLYPENHQTYPTNIPKSIPQKIVLLCRLFSRLKTLGNHQNSPKSTPKSIPPKKCLLCRLFRAPKLSEMLRRSCSMGSGALMQSCFRGSGR